jgi:hypothetical protein
MDTVRVKIIEYPGYCSLEARAGSVILFPFEYRQSEDKWYFWADEKMNPFVPTIFEGAEFPMEYFNNLCKARYFTLTGTDIWPSKVQIVAGKKFLKVAPSVR